MGGSLGVFEESAGARVFGCVEDLFSGAGFDDFAGLHVKDLIGKAAQEADGVGDKDKGAALANEFVEDLADIGASFGVEGAGGFVEKEDLGLHHEGADNGDALLFTAREGIGPSVGGVGDAKAFEPAFAFCDGLIAGDVGDVKGGFDDVLKSRFMREEVEMLKDHTDLTAKGLEAFFVIFFGEGGQEVDISTSDSALFKARESVDAAHERGFSRARASDDA